MKELFEQLSLTNIDRIVIDSLNIRNLDFQSLITSLNSLGFWSRIRKVISDRRSYYKYYENVKKIIKEVAEEKGLELYFLF